MVNLIQDIEAQLAGVKAAVMRQNVGVIREIGDGVARYEPALPDGEHHHHLVCDDCGRVEPFSDASLERSLERVAGRLGYDVAAHEVVLHGACGACRG